MTCATEENCLSERYNQLQHTSCRILTSLNGEEDTRDFKCPCADRVKVLVVDDNIFNIATVETILDVTYDLGSDKAMNGQEAIDQVL